MLIDNITTLITSLNWEARPIRFEKKIVSTGNERLVKMCSKEKIEDYEGGLYNKEREKDVITRQGLVIGLF